MDAKKRDVKESLRMVLQKKKKKASCPLKQNKNSQQESRLQTGFFWGFLCFSSFFFHPSPSPARCFHGNLPVDGEGEAAKWNADQDKLVCLAMHGARSSGGNRQACVESTDPDSTHGFSSLAVWLKLSASHFYL